MQSACPPPENFVFLHPYNSISAFLRHNFYKILYKRFVYEPILKHFLKKLFRSHFCSYLLGQKGPSAEREATVAHLRDQYTNERTCTPPPPPPPMQSVVVKEGLQSRDVFDHLVETSSNSDF